VNHLSEAFVGIDTSKLRNAVAVAEEGRDGEVRYLGEIDTTEAATRKLVIKLAGKYRQLTFCCEAGPTGYGLQVSSFMLRLGRHYPGKKTWGPAHMNWLMLQKLEHREQRIVLEELLGAVRQESERVERLEP
jgi:hypothetical protein